MPGGQLDPIFQSSPAPAKAAGAAVAQPAPAATHTLDPIFGGPAPTTTPSAASKPSSGGFWHDLIHNPVTKAVGQGSKDIASAAQHLPGGVVALGRIVYEGDKGVVTGNQKEQQQASDQIGDVVKAQFAQTKHDFAHPLSHPGNLVLDVLGTGAAGAGVLGRLGAAGEALTAGEDVGAVDRLAAAGKAIVTKPAPVTRLISHDGVAVEIPRAPNPLTGTLQKATDQLRMRFPNVPILGAAAKVGREVNRQLRYESKVRRLRRGRCSRRRDRRGC